MNEWAERLDQGNTQEFLERVLEAYRGRVAVVSSFGAESVVLIHLVAQIDCSVPVLFINTGKLFGETLRYRDRLQMLLGLTDVRTIGPSRGDIESKDASGTLFSRDPDACCGLRKVKPLMDALAPFECWMTGRKRFQSQGRSSLPRLEILEGLVRANPIADWSAGSIQAYIDQHRLPNHPLVKDGFLSIGCLPCTDRVVAGEHPRSGRWKASDKSECGIHSIGDRRGSDD